MRPLHGGGSSDAQRPYPQGDVPRDYGMRVGDLLKKSVVFLCRHNATTDTYRELGTAFLVSVSGRREPQFRRTYLVTAKHAVESAQTIEAGKKVVYIRINTSAGGFRYDPVFGDWWLPDTPGVDLAIIPIYFGPELHCDLLATLAEVFLTNETIRRLHIGEGDEVVVTGLFTSVTGKQKNRPIIRSGIIAAMPEEPIIEPDEDPYFAYLVEMRSTGGLSGSPVIVCVGQSRFPDGAINDKFFPWLLGIIRGHWPAPSSGHTAAFLADDVGQVQRGIATVTPIQELHAMLMSERALADREAMETAYVDEMGRKSMPDSNV